MSKVYSFKVVQNIPVTLKVAWDFFSAPENLKDITPETMGLRVTSVAHGEKMYPGQVIEYIVKPILGIPVYWMTEITHVAEEQFFVD